MSSRELRSWCWCAARASERGLVRVRVIVGVCGPAGLTEARGYVSGCVGSLWGTALPICSLNCACARCEPGGGRGGRGKSPRRRRSRGVQPAEIPGPWPRRRRRRPQAVRAAHGQRTGACAGRAIIATRPVVLSRRGMVAFEFHSHNHVLGNFITLGIPPDSLDQDPYFCVQYA